MNMNNILMSVLRTGIVAGTSGSLALFKNNALRSPNNFNLAVMFIFQEDYETLIFCQLTAKSHIKDYTHNIKVRDKRPKFKQSCWSSSTIT